MSSIRLGVTVATNHTGGGVTVGRVLSWQRYVRSLLLVRGLCVFLGLALFLGACGGDDDDDATPASEPASTTVGDSEDDESEDEESEGTSGVPRDEDDAFDVMTALASATWGSGIGFGAQEAQYQPASNWFGGYGRANGELTFIINVPDASDDGTSHCAELIALVLAYDSEFPDSFSVSPGVTSSSGFSDGADVECPDVDVAAHDDPVADTAPDDLESVVYRAADFLDQYFDRQLWFEDIEAVLNGDDVRIIVHANEEATPEELCEAVHPYAEHAMRDGNGAPIAFALQVNDASCSAV